MSGQSSGTNWGCVVLVVAMFVATACGFVALPMVVSAIGTNPHEWVREHYTHVSGNDPDVEPVVYSSDEDVTTVLAAVVAGTNPDETQRGQAATSATSPTGANPEDVNYLRYGNDWMIAVYPNGSQTQIEVSDFDEGYRRHGSHVGGWHRHRGSSFRGGGGGYGK